MGRDYRSPVKNALTKMVRAAQDRIMRWRGRPPGEAGVREPRRPRPTPPAGRVALDEPRIALYRRWMKPNDRRESP